MTGPHCALRRPGSSPARTWAACPGRPRRTTASRRRSAASGAPREDGARKGVQGTRGPANRTSERERVGRGRRVDPSPLRFAATRPPPTLSLVGPMWERRRQFDRARGRRERRLPLCPSTVSRYRIASDRLHLPVEISHRRLGKSTQESALQLLDGQELLQWRRFQECIYQSAEEPM